ncbi:methyltransferase domain-containing protein [Streptomyces alboflavus]|uniref:methyltransferase domain-containing protein n=1 Tax=Streptomyces alboflavus TaxID=67267 RepID=UPI003696B27C
MSFDVGNRAGDDGLAIDWDARAAAFDDEPDHGLRDPSVRAAWADRLTAWLPDTPGDVLDVGCGTGSLALLAAEQGHRVTAVDLSPEMATRARAKLTAHDARVLVGDAARPPVGDHRFDAILARHVLWTLPDPDAVLRHWHTLLRPGGRLVLIEGVWGTVSPVGIPAPALIRSLTPLVPHTHTERLSGDARLWGRAVDDERYVVVGTTARDVRRPPLPGALHHVELWVPDLKAAEASWGWLLGELGHVREQVWERGRSWRRGDAYLVLEESPDLRQGPHERRAPGMNHLAFHVADRAELDRLVALAPGHGWSPLYADRYPHAGGEAQYAAYLEDTQGYEVELVALPDAGA